MGPRVVIVGILRVSRFYSVAAPRQYRIGMRVVAAPSRQGRCRPHPSQTPPCGFPAVGSSGDSPRPRVSDPGTQQRMPRQQLLVARPREGLATCAPVEPMPPDAPGALKELIQTVVV